MNNEVLYTELQQNCIKAREELCWQNEVQKLVSIYEQLTMND